MRKTELKILSFAVIVCLFFSACEVVVGDEAIKGQWTLSETQATITIQEIDMYTYLTESEGLSEALTAEKIAEIEMLWVDTVGILNIAEDGTFTSTLNTTDASGSWEYAGNNLTLNGRSIDVGTLNNEVMILNISKMYLIALTEGGSLQNFNIDHRLILKK